MRIRLRLAVVAGVVALGALPASAGAALNRSGAHHLVRAALPEIHVSESEGCEFIADPGNAVCMLPFPDDYYTVPDATSPTGRRVDFKTPNLPANAGGEHIEADPYNDSDGFSPGSVILVKIPGITTSADLKASGVVPINHLARYSRSNAPVVVIDATTGKRWPIWVEIDTSVKSVNAPVEIHPAVNFTSGHRYIVAIRNLKNAKHEVLEAPAGFQYYRDNVVLRKRSHQRAQAALRRTLLDPGRRRHRTLEPLPGLGLHGRERLQQQPPRALDAQ